MCWDKQFQLPGKRNSSGLHGRVRYSSFAGEEPEWLLLARIVDPLALHALVCSLSLLRDEATF